MTHNDGPRGDGLRLNDASQFTSIRISYTHDQTTLGTLTYAYDAAVSAAA